MIDADLLDKPISTNKYTIYDIDSLPKLYLGFIMKNKFDEARTHIKSKYKPQYISHFTKSSKLEPVYMYGIEINPKTEYTPLLNMINEKMFLQNFVDYQKFKQTYRMLLSEYNLSCHNCYGYLSDGIYPIDVDHLTTISKKSFSSEIKSGLQKLLKSNEMPWYFKLANFKLFVLGKSSAYEDAYHIDN